jgi:FixJ family two-component response regulator
MEVNEPGARVRQTATTMPDRPLVSIVDDDVWARTGIGEFVGLLGYTVATFESAQDFLVSDCVENSACVITDLQMSNMTGLELQRQLRALGHCMPIILITAFPSEVHRAQALEAGAIGFLTKPLDERSLIECLSRAIGNPGS